MKVVVAYETTAVNSGHYHYLNDAETGSLCGSINEESSFASDIAEVLSRKSAERQGWTICGRCSHIAGQQPVDTLVNVD